MPPVLTGAPAELVLPAVVNAPPTPLARSSVPLFEQPLAKSSSELARKSTLRARAAKPSLGRSGGDISLARSFAFGG